VSLGADNTRTRQSWLSFKSSLTSTLPIHTYFHCRLETPQKEQSRTNQSSDQNPKDGRSNRRGQLQGVVDSRSEVPQLPSNRSSSMMRDHDRILKNIAEGREAEDDGSNDIDIWQHILSVGRDGNCMIQSFVRGMCFSPIFFIFFRISICLSYCIFAVFRSFLLGRR
jgi:hypothetical protein